MGDLLSRGAFALALVAACSADSSPSTLVATTPEPSGGNCPTGGVAIRTGVDDNGNGALDAAEIDSTSYVCAGTDGVQPIIRIDVEPPGPNCVAGGDAIHVGLDANRDGILQDEEIESTSFQCHPPPPTTIEGSVVIHNSLDAAQLVGVQHITGSMTVDADGLTSFDLSTLQRVDGEILVSNFSGSVVAFPVLQRAAALHVVPPVAVIAPVLTDCDTVRIQGAGTSNLHSLSTATYIELSDAEFDLGSLASVQFLGVNRAQIHADVLATVDSLDVNGAIPSLHLPALVRASQLIFSGVTLTSFEAPVLADVQDLAVQQADSFSTSLPLVTTLDALYVSGGAPSLVLPYLATATSVTYAGTTLAAVSLPALTQVTQELRIDNNANLTTFTAPLGPPMTTLVITANPMFPQCRALAIAAATQPTNQTINLNDTSATCP